MTNVTPPRVVTNQNLVIEVPLPAVWQEISLALHWCKQEMDKRKMEYFDDLWTVTSDGDSLVFTMELEDGE